ncbi:glycoside hydrolase family 3 C-terminal domain-containing protein [Verrucomicrobiota bacterium]
MTPASEPADVKLTDEDSIPKVIEEMTLQEKASLVGGVYAFETYGIERLGIPKLTLADGHNGVNIFHLLCNYKGYAAEQLGIEFGANDTWRRLCRRDERGAKALYDNTDDDPVVKELRPGLEEYYRVISEILHRELPAGLPSCLPPGLIMGATWDPEFVAEVGKVIALESRACGMDVMLGPNVNIHRDPLCGRVFESYSEDPCLAARIGVGYIQGVQSEGVAAVVKHYVANNQEFERMSVNARITERALREIYFPAFKAAVREAGCWMVMSAYNSVNGKPCAMHPWLLKDVLRGEWGFTGFVVSDWGAAYDRIAALQSGNDLEMPGPIDVQEIVAAVESGKLDAATLDERISNILRIMLKLPAFKGTPRHELDREYSARIARKLAVEGTVLLKNDNDTLPLAEGRVAVFGDNAKEPISTGGGSAGVVSPYVVSVLDGLAARYGEDNVVFGELPDDADLAVVCVGVTSCEGADRETLDLEARDLELIRDTARQCRDKGKKSVVVLNVCGPVEMASWVGAVDAVVLPWLGGMEMGHAVADVLSGDAAPSGKLPLTFPRRYKDVPACLNFPGEFGEVIYGEGIYVGYRYYDTVDVEPLYEFGYGLSYTTFELRDLKLSSDTLEIKRGHKLTVSVNIENTGKRSGKEVVQLYVQDVASTVQKAAKELKGFEKVALEPGKKKTVDFAIEAKALAHYDTKLGRWCVEPGVFRLMVGTSSRDIRVTAELTATGPNPYGDEGQDTAGDNLGW